VTTLAALGAWSRESEPLFASTPCLHSTWGVCLSTESLTIFSGQLTWMSWWLNSYIALRWLLTTGRRGGKVCHRILHGEQVVWPEATPRQNGRLKIHQVLVLFLIDLLYGLAINWYQIKILSSYVPEPSLSNVSTAAMLQSSGSAGRRHTDSDLHFVYMHLGMELGIGNEVGIFFPISAHCTPSALKRQKL